MGLTADAAASSSPATQRPRRPCPARWDSSWRRPAAQQCGVRCGKAIAQAARIGDRERRALRETPGRRGRKRGSAQIGAGAAASLKNKKRRTFERRRTRAWRHDDTAEQTLRRRGTVAVVAVSTPGYPAANSFRVSSTMACRDIRSRRPQAGNATPARRTRQMSTGDCDGLSGAGSGNAGLITPASPGTGGWVQRWRGASGRRSPPARRQSPTRRRRRAPTVVRSSRPPSPRSAPRSACPRARR